MWWRRHRLPGGDVFPGLCLCPPFLVLLLCASLRGFVENSQRGLWSLQSAAGPYDARCFGGGASCVVKLSLEHPHTVPADGAVGVEVEDTTAVFGDGDVVLRTVVVTVCVHVVLRGAAVCRWCCTNRRTDGGHHCSLEVCNGGVGSVSSSMESPLVDDDICILKHETAYMAESPVAVCSGDESVASHFALVTAYEDIKKRLRDTERENAVLRRRVKQLEDKLFRPEAPPSEGPQYMNKAFSAYRGIYMEKKDLQAELNKLKKERAESERMLTEQLQAKELEILQLRSEMETSQVMKSLNETQDYWQVERSSSELQIHTLQEELDRLRLENSRLEKLCSAAEVRESGLLAHTLSSLSRWRGCGERSGARTWQCFCQEASQSPAVKHEESQQVAPNSRALAVLSSYEDVCSEMSRLRALLKAQSDLVKKLRPPPPVLRRGQYSPRRLRTPQLVPPHSRPEPVEGLDPDTDPNIVQQTSLCAAWVPSHGPGSVGPRVKHTAAGRGADSRAELVLHRACSAAAQLSPSYAPHVPYTAQCLRTASALPVQCLDDVETNSSPVRVTAPRPPSAPPLPSSGGRPGASAMTEGLQEILWKSQWPLQRPPPLGSPGGPSTPQNHSSTSLDDGSWSIPNHPRPSDAQFWEGPKSGGSSSEWAKPY
ncbi:hypothetical protein NFI96_021707 [Prochilodus magdalenae]|nr:hypothetical protein NFI96_021707 [Prochilodus magdalenae]